MVAVPTFLGGPIHQWTTSHPTPPYSYPMCCQNRIGVDVAIFYKIANRIEANQCWFGMFKMGLVRIPAKEIAHSDLMSIKIEASSRWTVIC
jgi:hypothetical protein